MSKANISRREDIFDKQLGDTDSLQIIVRGHLHIEAELIDFLSESISMVRPKAIDIADLSFRKKVELAIALGLISPTNKKPFLELNALRNKVAHNLELEISSEHAEKLYSSFPPFFKHLYGKAPASFTRYRIIIRQCLRVMWVDLNQKRFAQFQLKLDMERDHKKVQELREKYKDKNPSFK